MSKLVDYIVKDHSNLSQKKIAFKFPNVSADLLSVNSEKVFNFFSKKGDNESFPHLDKLTDCLDSTQHQNELMSYSQNLDSKIQDFNSSASTIKPNNSTFNEVNHTRGGYIYKILNNLLTSKPLIFAPYLLNNAKVQKSLIQNSQCKSIAMIMVTLLTLPQQSGMNNNMMMNNAMNFQNENNTQQAEHTELLTKTLDKRLELLNELVTRCIVTVENSELEDLHNNFCYVINNLFLREFGNKKKFISYIIDNFYEELLTAFLNSKADNIGNKLGQVVHSITDTILNKAEKMDLKFEDKVFNSLSKHSVDMIEFIREQSSIKSMGLWQRTYSSTQELNIISPKTYKVFEILNLILKQESRSESFLTDESLSKSDIDKNLYRFYIEHPLNNILHNVVTSFIISIGNSKFEKSKIKFAKNDGFFDLLNEITDNRNDKAFKQKKCYMGHLKKLANFFSPNLLKNEDDKRWINFTDNFLKEENEKENKALGDVYVNNVNDDDGIMFSFTLDEIKEKYSVFLGFKTEEEEIKSIEEKNENKDKTEDKKEDSSKVSLLASSTESDSSKPESTDNECKLFFILINLRFKNCRSFRKFRKYKLQ